MFLSPDLQWGGGMTGKNRNSQQIFSKQPHPNYQFHPMASFLACLKIYKKNPEVHQEKEKTLSFTQGEGMHTCAHACSYK